jgi:hypothetical protein
MAGVQEWLELNWGGNFHRVNLLENLPDRSDEVEVM